MKKKKKIHSQLQKETHKSGSGISSNSFSAPQNNRLDKSITKTNGFNLNCTNKLLNLLIYLQEVKNY